MKKLHAYVEEAARAYPDREALVFADQSYSYRQLDERALAVKKYIDSGEAEHTVIAVYGSKRYATYCAILGILRSGNAYCPLNPKFPLSRNVEILSRSKSPLLIGHKEDEAYLQLVEYLETQTALLVSTDEKGEFLFVTLNQHPSLPLHDAAYLLFTSGTTGRPKGVLITHAQVSPYLDHVKAMLNISSSDRCSHTFDLTFDLSIHDLFLTWSSGAALCVPAAQDLLSPAAYIKAMKITVWFSVPSLADLMRKIRQLKPGNLEALALMIFCGEALPYALVKDCMQAAPGARIINLYGPTEATIAISAFEIDKDALKEGIVEIGQLFEGNAYRLSANNELLLNGSQVIASYYTDDNTDQFELADNKIWYRTGDRVEVKDGIMAYKGRLDDQVKLNGYRVELGEIEQLASQYLGGKHVVCVPLKEQELVRRLALVIEGPQDEALAEGLRKYLKIKLPAYMLPELLRFADKLPLNSNGKTDRKAILELIHA